MGNHTIMDSGNPYTNGDNGGVFLSDVLCPTRSAVCLADAGQEAWFYVRGCAHARAGHRGNLSGLRSHSGRVVDAPAVFKAAENHSYLAGQNRWPAIFAILDGGTVPGFSKAVQIIRCHCRL